MDPLASLLSFSFIIFSLLIGGIVFGLRTVVEFFWKTAQNNKVWEEIILPIFPVILGGVLAFFMTMYPYSIGFTSTSGRIAFGAVAGLLSGLLYRVVKSLLKQKLTTIVQAVDTTITSTTTNTDIIAPPSMGQNSNVNK